MLNNSVKSVTRALAVGCGRKCVICVIWKVIWCFTWKRV